jgi:toxin ParE1/3/4
MASYKLLISAEVDLENIYYYGVLNYGLKQADKYYDNLFQCFENIAVNPYLYSAVDYLRIGYRRSVYHSHSIYYRIIENNNIEIIRILGKQLPI